jgi:hypothetical protein
MQHPLAYCRQHGFFPASAFAFAVGAKVNISGCSTSCPKCGTPSEIVPGAYDASLQTINVLVDPSISNDALAALRKLINRVETGEITPAQATVEAKKISPKLGGMFDPSTWSPEVKAAAIAAIAYLLGQASGCGDAPVVKIYPPAIEEPAHRAKPDGRYSVRLTDRLREARIAERLATKNPEG